MFRYRIDDGPEALAKDKVQGYIGEVSVAAVTASDETFVLWTSSWGASGGGVAGGSAGDLFLAGRQGHETSAGLRPRQVSTDGQMVGVIPHIGWAWCIGAKAGIADHGDADVQIECDHGGMMTKGRVQVRNFGVRDIAMQNVASMFP